MKNKFNPQNVKDAITSFFLWLKWYPADYSGAVVFAGDECENEDDVIELTRQLEEIKNLPAKCTHPNIKEYVDKKICPDCGYTSYGHFGEII